MALIQSGYEHFVYNQKPEWASMNNGSGAREYVLPVVFNSPFLVRPEVVVSTAMLDSFGNTNQRFSLRAAGAHTGGFNLVFHTWENTRIFAIGVSWIAYDSRLANLSALEGIDNAPETPEPEDLVLPPGYNDE